MCPHQNFSRCRLPAARHAVLAAARTWIGMPYARGASLRGGWLRLHRSRAGRLRHRDRRARSGGPGLVARLGGGMAAEWRAGRPTAQWTLFASASAVRAGDLDPGPRQADCVRHEGKALPEGSVGGEVELAGVAGDRGIWFPAIEAAASSAAMQSRIDPEARSKRRRSRGVPNTMANLRATIASP